MIKPDLTNTNPQTQPLQKVLEENSNPRKLTTSTKTQATDNFPRAKPKERKQAKII